MVQGIPEVPEEVRRGLVVLPYGHALDVEASCRRKGSSRRVCRHEAKAHVCEVCRRYWVGSLSHQQQCPCWEGAGR